MSRSRVLRAAKWFCIAALCCSMCAASAQLRTERESPRAKAAEAVDRLFMRSDLDGARAAAQLSLKLSRNYADRFRQSQLDALFVEMEASALQADTPAELEAALKLCELRGGGTDPRVAIAAARILDLAANSAEFRPAIHRIRALILAGASQSNYLRAALLEAGSDGLPGYSVLALARESGLLTDWRVAGPFGAYPSIAFDRTWPPEKDELSRNDYDGRAVERFRFPTGTFTLPGYFPTDGVLYASSEAILPVAGEWRVRIESAGSLKLFVDGDLVVTKDDRFRATPEIAWSPINVTAGPHRITVKFLASAAPFRVALLKPENRDWTGAAIIANPVEADYIRAAKAYWSGDYGGAIDQLTELRQTHESAALDFLLAKAWSHTGGSTSEAKPLLKSALKLSSSAFAAEYELAEQALADEHDEEALQRAQTVTRSRPAFEPALHIAGLAAARLNWQSEAARAYEQIVKVHGSCTAIHEAAEFSASISDHKKADYFESLLDGCAPSSLAWAKTLADAGRHYDAAVAARKIVAEEPLDREARELLVRELTLAGETNGARIAARELSAIAPNSFRLRRMAMNLESNDTMASSNPLQAAFPEARQFYSQYRRDGLAIVQKTTARNFSGGPAVCLLHDRVAQLQAGGSVALYVHRITRVLDRDGILQYGEVTIPEGASILELRTVKRDGTVAEPEFNQHKATISMPALSPGDAIEVEYVLRYPEGDLREHHDAFQFAFGSFAAPILYSRFVVLSPAQTPLQFSPAGDVPPVKLQAEGDFLVRIWERNDIPQSSTEISMPLGGLLPEIHVFEAADGWADVRDFYREALINAARVGTKTISIARTLEGTNDEQRLRSAYRLVTSKVRPRTISYASGEIPAAESTLATYIGSRTIALLALGEAMGIRGELVMAREIGTARGSAITPQAYPRPLALFHIDRPGIAHDIVLDPDDEGIGFGGISPTIARTDAIIVPLHDNERVNDAVIAALPEPLLEDRSRAEGDVVVDIDGNLIAHITIRMGAGRSAQMRSILSAIPPEGRKHFFEQLAARIFAGASDAEGEVHNELDSDHPLELLLNCRAPRFVDFRQSVADLDQLVPSLGLRKMYQAVGPRRLPLYIDTPLIETATFHVKLPPRTHFVSLPVDVQEQNEFGTYSVTFHQLEPHAVDIRREFQIPVQVVDADHFDRFSRFAKLIDDAERQRLTIEQSFPASAAR